jgi:hypothetical protein
MHSMIALLVIVGLFVGLLLSYGASRFPTHAKLIEVCAGFLLLSAFFALGFCLR